MVVSLSEFLGLRSWRGAVVSDLLGVFLDSFWDGFCGDWLIGDGDLSGFLLLLIESLLMMGPLDFLLSSGSEGLLIVGDVEGLEWIGHRILILKII